MQGFNRCRMAFPALVAALIACSPSMSLAQTWPNKIITMIVPFPAGGPTDALARRLANDMGERLGQKIVVDNRAGAGGNIGAALVAQAKPDGYTILFTTPGPGANNKLLYKSMPFDPEKDFTSIAVIAESPLVILASPQTSINTMPELIAYAKAHPGELNSGNPGNGTLGHIATALFSYQAGIKLTPVPYRGSAPLTTDLLGGQVQLGFDFIPTYIQHIEAGKLRALAVTTAKRSDLLPNVPSVKESGVANFEAVAWYALEGPKNLPGDIVRKLNAAVNEFLNTDSAKEALKTLGMSGVGGNPEALTDLISRELAKWGPIIKEADIRME
jgi:tripartite-type tricarboxylate transporter receptor subunit TctC